MSTSFSAKELALASNGAWHGAIMLDKANYELYTDSRVKGNNRCFIAIKGERFDAHNHLQDAIDSGAGALCIDEDKIDKVPPFCPIPVLAVKDTTWAYQKFANFHRKRFPNLAVVGVTGSVGKTSVKEMLRAIFSHVCDSEDSVLFTIGNTNNQIGVPQNLLRLNNNHKFAVIEMGTNSPNEIAPLSLCAEPTVAIVNSIAPCHLEKLLSLEGVAYEKAQIWQGVSGPKATAIFPQECSAIEVLENHCKIEHIIRFGNNSNAQVYGKTVSDSLSGSKIALYFNDSESYELEWALSGEHQAQNAAAAAAAAFALGIQVNDIVKGIAKTTLPGMRMAQSVINNVTYINDAYNANPESMVAAIKMLSNSTNEGENLILVVGDMLELGDFEHENHLSTLNLIQKHLPLSRVITVGPRMARAAMSLSEHDWINCCGSSEAAKGVLAKMVSAGDTVFLKGSRGMALEGVLPV